MSIVSSILLFIVSGCDAGDKEEAVLSQYVADLNRSHFFSAVSPTIVMPNTLPAKRNRQQDLSEFDIGLLDFLSLQQCDVGFLAGKKNSILGKVMPSSQRFLYELDIIRAIESCDIKDSELLQSLRQTAQQKRAELPVAFANAIFNGEEGAAFFSLSNGFFLLDHSTEKDQALLSALNRLVSIGDKLSHVPVIDSHIFEQDLKTLMDSEYAGRLLYSLVRVTAYLETVSAEVNRLSNVESVCEKPMVFFKQQFEHHYVDVVQPYMGRINRSAYRVLPLLNQLFKQSEPLTDEMAHFVKQFSLTGNQSVWSRYQQASQKHALEWSQLFKRCSISFVS